MNKEDIKDWLEDSLIFGIAIFIVVPIVTILHLNAGFILVIGILIGQTREMIKRK